MAVQATPSSDKRYTEEEVEKRMRRTIRETMAELRQADTPNTKGSSNSSSSSSTQPG